VRRRRQRRAPSSRTRYPNPGLGAMMFMLEDGERMEALGIDDIDTGETLEPAAGHRWEPTPDQPLRGS
jgi:hypothetical protein